MTSRAAGATPDLRWCVALVDTTAVLPDGTHPVVFLGPATDARPGDTILVPMADQGRAGEFRPERAGRFSSERPATPQERCEHMVAMLPHIARCGAPATVVGIIKGSLHRPVEFPRCEEHADG